METVIHAESGDFVGYEEEGCRTYSGIRYAQSTAFSRPEPFVYKKLCHAVDPAPFAVQVASPVEDMIFGMDYEKVVYDKSCQYLSITLPQETEAGDRLPVMIFFHGGSYTNGGLEAIGYDRIPMARENRVIVISMNYRLGLLGFTKDSEGKPANNGLLDALEGLRWVQKNIAAFGGDPDQVTLFGQSAGGDLVRFIVLSEGSEDLYQRAIIESDPLGADTDEKAEIRDFMIREIQDLDDSSSIEEIQRAYVELKGKLKPKTDAKFMPFAPIYGVDPVVKKEDLDAHLDRIFPGHDLLIGYTQHELRAYVPTSRALTFFEAFIVTRPIVHGVLSKLRNRLFKEPALAFANRCKAHGAKVHLYEFCWAADHRRLGGWHGPGADMTRLIES